ncbi:MAG: CBS domain-containing protein [Thermodesulfobacteriota bacterium]
MLLRMRAWDIMREEFPRVEEDASLSRIIKEMNKSRKEQPDNNCVLVFSKNDDFLGVVSMWNVLQSMGPCLLKSSGLSEKDVDWDRAFAQACRLCSQVRLKDILQKDVPRVRPNDPLARIMEIFLDYRRGRAVVTEGGRVMGLVLLSDLYKEIARDVEEW